MSIFVLTNWKTDMIEISWRSTLWCLKLPTYSTKAMFFTLKQHVPYYLEILNIKLFSKSYHIFKENILVIFCLVS